MVVDDDQHVRMTRQHRAAVARSVLRSGWRCRVLCLHTSNCHHADKPTG